MQSFSLGSCNTSEITLPQTRSSRLSLLFDIPLTWSATRRAAPEGLMKRQPLSTEDSAQDANCSGLNNYRCYGPILPYMAIASNTTDIPQNDIGNYSELILACKTEPTASHEDSAIRQCEVGTCLHLVSSLSSRESLADLTSHPKP